MVRDMNFLESHDEYPTLKLPDIKFLWGRGGFDIKYTVKKSINVP